MTRGQARDLAVVVLAVVVLALSGGMVFALHRIYHDEGQTCTIQARGLPAGKHLAVIISDIHQLFTVRPMTAAERRAAAHTPKVYRDLERSLASNAGAYATIEAHQPQRRAC